MAASSGLLIFLNAIYILGGLGCLVLGTLGITEVLEDVSDVAGKAVWYMIYHLPGVDPDDVFDDDLSEYDVGYTVLLVSGVVLLLMGFAGLIGTVRRNGCLLTTAWVVLSFVLIVVLVVAVAFPIFAWVKTKADCDTQEEKYDVLAEYVHKNKTVRVLIDFDEVQKKYECCGVRNTTDWVKAAEDSDGVVDIVPVIPNSCCGKPADGEETCRDDEIYNKSCDEDIDEWMQDNVYLKLVICLAIGILLSFLLIASIALTCLMTGKLDRGEKF